VWAGVESPVVVVQMRTTLSYPVVGDEAASSSLYVLLLIGWESFIK
jgi:hypothetical protein